MLKFAKYFYTQIRILRFPLSVQVTEITEVSQIEQNLLLILS